MKIEFVSYNVKNNSQKTDKNLKETWGSFRPLAVRPPSFFQIFIRFLCVENDVYFFFLFVVL